MVFAVCAVDVGTAGARAGLFDADGNLLGRADAPVEMRQQRAGQAEHNSTQIWQAVCAVVKAARREAGIDANAVRGIAFDATCSLVVQGADGTPLPVSADGGDGWDTISWFDHRALNEAEACTATGHPVIASAGGAMSPEMQIPKLMWLKHHLPRTWQRAGAIRDLADFLTHRASGSNARSLNTLTCKWAYRPSEPDPWPRDFLDAVGLPDIAERAGLSEAPARVGVALGNLLPDAARDLGLTASCRVATGVVDAFAGVLGVLGGLPAADLDTHAALIAGTSSCVMIAVDEPRTRFAIWGPYPDVALPGLWMSEAGQSATGALLDHVIRMYGLPADAVTHARIAGRVAELRVAEGARFAERLHVLPDFHGNRSPFADPNALGVIHGLNLDASFEGLCRLYWRTCVAIVLGVRHIVEALRAAGQPVDTLHVAGGHLKNPLLMELYADAVDCIIVEPATPEPVLLGTAMLAATAAGVYGDLQKAMRAMSRPGIVRARSASADYGRDYRVFLEMHRHRQHVDAIG